MLLRLIIYALLLMPGFAQVCSCGAIVVMVFYLMHPSQVRSRLLICSCGMCIKRHLASQA